MSINPLIYCSAPSTPIPLSHSDTFIYQYLPLSEFYFLLLFLVRLHLHGGFPADLEAAERLSKDGDHRWGHLRPGCHHRHEPRRQHWHRRIYGGFPAHWQKEPAGTRTKHVYGHGLRPYKAGGGSQHLTGETENRLGGQRELQDGADESCFNDAHEDVECHWATQVA